ncbi:leucine-rich repeat protein [Kordia antarctica]
MLDGQTVIAIGDTAFEDFSLTNVIIPNSVTTIGVKAFNNNLLTNITISDFVTSIGIRAFQSNQLNSVTLGNSLVTIGNYSFNYNTLTHVTIPNSVTSIGFAAFENNLLASVTIGNSVETIDQDAFASNPLTSVSIPNSVISIGESAFEYTMLATVTLGNSLEIIGDSAFAYSEASLLTSVTIPESVTFIGPGAFIGNPSLSGFNFPSINYYDSSWAASGGTIYNNGDTTTDFVSSYTLTKTAIIYSITYHLDGGTATNPASYNVEDSEIILNAATKNGYIFDGWYTEDTFMNEVTSIAAGSNGNIDLYAAFENVTVAPKVFLQGAALNPATEETSLMRDDLRSNNYIPTTSPYGDGLTCDANVLNASGTANNDIVDWVWIELRDATDNTLVKASRSALLQRDGNIVEVDGISYLKFEVATDNYYVAVHHRNHLGIISNNTIALSKTVTTVDFTDANNQITFGSNAQTTFGMQTGKIAMWTGNVNNDTVV